MSGLHFRKHRGGKITSPDRHSVVDVHFNQELIENIRNAGVVTDESTLVCIHWEGSQMVKSVTSSLTFSGQADISHIVDVIDTRTESLYTFVTDLYKKYQARLTSVSVYPVGFRLMHRSKKDMKLMAADGKQLVRILRKIIPHIPNLKVNIKIVSDRPCLLPVPMCFTRQAEVQRLNSCETVSSGYDENDYEAEELLEERFTSISSEIAQQRQIFMEQLDKNKLQNKEIHDSLAKLSECLVPSVTEGLMISLDDEQLRGIEYPSSDTNSGGTSTSVSPLLAEGLPDKSEVLIEKEGFRDELQEKSSVSSSAARRKLSGAGSKVEDVSDSDGAAKRTASKRTAPKAKTKASLSEGTAEKSEDLLNNEFLGNELMGGSSYSSEQTKLQTAASEAVADVLLRNKRSESSLSMRQTTKGTGSKSLSSASQRSDAHQTPVAEEAKDMQSSELAGKRDSGQLLENRTFSTSVTSQEASITGDSFNRCKEKKDFFPKTYLNGSPGKESHKGTKVKRDKASSKGEKLEDCMSSELNRIEIQNGERDNIGATSGHHPASTALENKEKMDENESEGKQKYQKDDIPAKPKRSNREEEEQKSTAQSLYDSSNNHYIPESTFSEAKSWPAGQSSFSYNNQFPGSSSGKNTILNGQKSCDSKTTDSIARHDSLDNIGYGQDCTSAFCKSLPRTYFYSSNGRLAYIEDILPPLQNYTFNNASLHYWYHYFSSICRSNVHYCMKRETDFTLQKPGGGVIEWTRVDEYRVSQDPPNIMEGLPTWLVTTAAAPERYRNSVFTAETALEMEKVLLRLPSDITKDNCPEGDPEMSAVSTLNYIREVTSISDDTWKLVEEALLPELKLPPRAHKALDTVLCLDTSGNMTHTAYQLVQKIARTFIEGIQNISDQFELEENIAIVTLGNPPKIQHHLTNDYNSLLDVIDDLATGGRGYSACLEGLMLSLAALTKGGVCNLDGHLKLPPRLIFVTDGITMEKVNNCKNEVEQWCFMKGIEELGSHFTLTHVVSPVTVVTHGVEKTDYIKNLLRRCQGELVNDIRCLCEHQRTQRICAQILKFVRNTCGYEKPGELHVESITQELTAHLSSFDKNRIMKTLKTSLPQQKAMNDTEAFDNIYEENCLLPLGSRVTRGPDWKWQNEDSECPGTVINHDYHGYVWVLWDSGYRHCYRYGTHGFYDVLITDDCPQLIQNASNPIEIGMLVERGPDWLESYGNQDGGPGNYGAVIRKAHRRVMVLWKGGYMHIYRFGENGKFDVTIKDPSDLKKRPNS